MRLLTFMVGLALLSPATALAGVSPGEKQVELAASKAVKIVVRENGWYSVSRRQLARAGLSRSAPASRLQLWADGSQVPILVRGVARGSLASNGSIEFYGRNRDLVSTDARTYWLVVGSAAGKRIPVSLTGRGGATAPPRSFPFTFVRKDFSHYFPLPNGTTRNFFGAGFNVDPVSQTLAVSHLDPAAKSATLRVALQGWTVKPHRVHVKLNDSDLGDVTYNNQVPAAFRFTFPASAIKNGTNVLSLRSLGGELDWSLLAEADLTYQHLYRAAENVLKFTLPAGRRVHVTGFSSRDVRVLDSSNAARPRVIQPRVTKDGRTYRIAVAPARRARRLIALTSNHLKHPASVVAERPSDLHKAGEGADMLIITSRSFFPALQPLQALRESQGLKVKLVDVNDIYDEFDYGIHGPDAIRSFVRYARDHWKPSPRYLLLVGDATYDPRNFLKTGRPDLVPTMMVDTLFDETASDGWFTDFDKDGIPDLAVGRLPVQTVSQAKVVVSKIVSYERAGARNPNGALLVSDKNEGWDFETATNDLGKLVSGSMSVTITRRSEAPTDAAAKTKLISELAGGPAVVNYFGHGAPAIWSKTGYLETKDVSKLTNANSLSLYVMMTCNNAYFVDPTQVSLSEALLLSPAGGAVASVASSGYVDAGAQTTLDREFFRVLLANPTWRLGDIVDQAKKAITDQDLRRTELVIGDPAMTLHF
jgi:Peptidase family C25